LELAANRIRESQSVEKLAIMNELMEVVNRKRGFCAVTQNRARMAGVPLDTISNKANQLGLYCKLHGKLGLTFTTIQPKKEG